MKKLLPLFVIMTLLGTFSVFGQSELILEENFQLWEPTEGVYSELDSCGTYPPSEYLVTREMDLLTSDGWQTIKAHMVKVVIKPECPSRRVYDSGGTLPAGVSVGWVQLQKITDEFNTVENFDLTADTIGELVFGPIPQIDSIYISHSATGSKRGFRIYTSPDGEYWERPTDLEFWDCADCQAGDSNVIEIFENDVYIKITSGFADDTDKTSQYSRIHDIRVWGTPGVFQSIENPALSETRKILYLGDNKYQLDTELTRASVISILGKETRIRKTDNMLDLSSLAPGIYIIKAENSQGTIYVEKVYKQ